MRKEAKNGHRGSAGQRRHSGRCAFYTRKSTEEGLDQQYNSLDSQRDAGEAYIRSQANEGWDLLCSSLTPTCTTIRPLVH